MSQVSEQKLQERLQQAARPDTVAQLGEELAKAKAALNATRATIEAAIQEREREIERLQDLLGQIPVDPIEPEEQEEEVVAICHRESRA